MNPRVPNKFVRHLAVFVVCGGGFLLLYKPSIAVWLFYGGMLWALGRFLWEGWKAWCRDHNLWGLFFPLWGIAFFFLFAWLIRHPQVWWVWLGVSGIYCVVLPMVVAQANKWIQQQWPITSHEPVTSSQKVEQWRRQVHGVIDYVLSGLGIFLIAGFALLGVYLLLDELLQDLLLELRMPAAFKGYGRPAKTVERLFGLGIIIFLGWIGLYTLSMALKKWQILPAWFPPRGFPPHEKEEKHRNYEAAQKQVDDLHALFDAALRVCSAYGTVLDDSPVPFGAASALPSSKETIKTAIVTLYNLLESSKVAGWVRVWYPEHAEEILSEKFRHALQVGYSCLPQYVSDEEAHILAQYFQLFSDNREKVQTVLEGEDQAAKLQLARSLAEQVEQSVDPALPILQRMCEESAQSLIELEQRRKQFRRTMQIQDDT